MLDYGYQTHEPPLEEQNSNNINTPTANTTTTTNTADTTTSPTTTTNPTATTSTSTTTAESDITYTPLVVSSIQEYVSLAVRLTHQPKLRLFHSERILARRHRLFQQDNNALLAQWKLFAHLALHNATLNNRMYDDNTQHSAMIPDLLEIPVDLAAPPPPLLAPSAPPSYRSSVKSSPSNKVEL